MRLLLSLAGIRISNLIIDADMLVSIVTSVLLLRVLTGYLGLLTTRQSVSLLFTAFELLLVSEISRLVCLVLVL